MLNKESDKELLERFGKHIKALREEKGLSGAEMARRCYMDRSNYFRLEEGGTNPTLKTITLLCRNLDVDYQKLFTDFPLKD